MNKRGLSEVITTVLIILITLAAVVLLWTFIRPTLQSASKQIGTQDFTTSFDIPNQYVFREF